MNEYALHQHFISIYYFSQLYPATFLMALSTAFTKTLSTFFTLQEQDTGLCPPVLLPEEILIMY